MRIRLDPTKCDGFGACAHTLPELFSLDEWGYAVLERSAEVPSGKEADARRAIAECPTAAIAAE